MFILLDSGAYSAWTQRKDVHLDDYCAFIHENIEHIDAYVSLDVIPGVKGRSPNAAEVESSAAQGWRNLLYMRDTWSLDPIPVFHQGESFKWLDMMLAEGCTYIGLSPRIMGPTQIKRRWLDSVWQRLVREDGTPRVKTHGFGMNALPLLFRYPWHTVDASTWLKRAVFGKILMPHTHRETGAWDFSKVPRDVSISSKAKQWRPDVFARHRDSERDQVSRWVEECGETVSRCAESNRARCVVNAHFFKRVTELNAGAHLFNPHAPAIFDVHDEEG